MRIQVPTSAQFNGPVFLVGMPRSGTKLLRDLLNQHPRISIPSIETEFLPGILKKYALEKIFTWKEFRHLYEELSKFSYFNYLAESGHVLKEEDWYTACATPNLPGLFEALIRCSTNTAGRNDVLWGDKSPSYISHITVLKQAYPDARFIHIVRDVRDYAISISKAWGKNRLRAAQRWADSLDAIEKDIAPISKDVLVVRYEDLLDNPESVLRLILDFLDLEFDARVLELQTASENIGDTRGETAIVSTNKNKYKSMMPSTEIESLEKLAGSTLGRYGYATDYEGPRKRLSRLAEIYYQLQDAMNLVRAEKDKRGYVGSIIFYWRYFRATRGL